MHKFWIVSIAVLLLAQWNPAAAATGASLRNRFANLVIGADGRNVRLVDLSSGTDYTDRSANAPFASVKCGEKVHDASAVSSDGDRMRIEFGDSGITAVIRAKALKQYFTLEVLSLAGGQVDEFTFLNARLTLKAEMSEPFGACAMALNLKTNVTEIPGLNTRLHATCYPRFGLEGAKVAIVACPPGEMRSVMREVVKAAKELPQSAVGGPWALDAEINRGSYLFNFTDLTEDTVDDWIKLVKSLGMNQIDFHGGQSFRFGDLRPNPKLYPNGRASLKAVIDKLHAAGIKAGLHTYAFFMDKGCPWVTPVPHPELGKKGTFTLAEDISTDAMTVPVTEPTDKITTITGFFEPNSVTVQIDDELITFSAASKESPYGFTVAQRGAHGTRVSAHSKGANVHHLMELFGLFTPGGDSDLLAEVAKTTAETFNECGFDMIYLDALDGAGVLGGSDNFWHYSSRFVFEIFKHLKRPPLMEMSTFHHHLWYARSRIGAWDHPAREQKRFIDRHCDHNAESSKMFLAAQLGWWTITMGDDVQEERTFPDEIEYLMAKCLATNTGFALMGIDPKTIETVPVYRQLAPIFKQYEELRYANYFSDAAKERLRQQGAEFTLEPDGAGGWRFRPIAYARHKVSIASGESTTWTTTNGFGKQPLRVRMEALMSAAPYDSPEAVVLAEPGTVKSGDDSLCRLQKTFDPALKLGQRQALGVWVTGDGQGELLNFQVRSPQHLARGLGDHYIDVDFTGRRYFELIEPESERIMHYQWPYGGNLYAIYREETNYEAVGSFSIWYNDVPKGKQASCEIGPVKALPLVKTKLINPRITVNGATIAFPIELESGSYIEFRSPTDCKAFGPKGEPLGEVTPTGPVPQLTPGENTITFSCESPDGVSARARVTVITRGEETFK